MEKQMAKSALLEGLVIGRYTIRYVARRLSLTERRVRQLRKAAAEAGIEALVHGNKGKIPANRISDETRNKIVAIIKSEKYKTNNFSQINKLLFQREGIKISYSTLLRIMNNEGIDSFKKHAERRNNSQNAGEVLQFCTLCFGERYKLHIVFDEFQHRLTGLSICKSECIEGYVTGLEQTLKRYGLPMGVYIKNKKKDYISTLKALIDKLGIDIQDAPSLQGTKGIKKLELLLRSHLEAFFLSKNIQDVVNANKNMPEFMNSFNDEFCGNNDEESYFIPVQDSVGIDALIADAIQKGNSP